MRYSLAACLAVHLLLIVAGFAAADAADEESWAATVKFPEGEKTVKLFDGKTFEGWEGNTGADGAPKYFTIKDGVIIARNEKENAPKVSNYLLTKKSYRNLRLRLEGKLVESKMHSGVALWGKKCEKDGEKSLYQGHLVMFPTHWGFWALYRRNSIYQDDGRAKKADNVGGWNKMEILAIGNRIQLAVNGQAVADWSDPKPELCEEGPIGLQLHSSQVPQECQFRVRILSEKPKEELITVEK